MGSCRHIMYNTLLIVMDYWIQSLNDGYPVDMIYLYFRKAFESVSCNWLLKEFNVYGISGCFLDWMQDFLSGRQEKVFLNGDHSSWSTVSSKVPLELILSPNHSQNRDSKCFRILLIIYDHSMCIMLEFKSFFLCAFNMLAYF